MANAQDKQRQTEVAAIHKKFKKDISDIQTKADLLAGTAQINTITVKGKKIPAIKKVEINKNLPEFMRFMEANYKNSNIKVELKRKI